MNKSRSHPINSPQLQLAIQHHQAGRLQKAEAIYKKMPGNADAVHLLGVIAYQSGKHQVAIDYINKAIGLFPDNADYYCNLGSAHHALSQLDQAIANYSQALALKSAYPLAHNNLGNAFKEQGRLEEAIICYRNALALQPDLVLALNNLGSVLMELGRVDEAIIFLENALALAPNFVEALSNLGNALLNKGMRDEAIMYYRKAVELQPDFFKLYNNLGSALKDQGNLDEAVACFQKALLLEPNAEIIHSNILLTQQYSPDLTPQQVFAEHLRFASHFETPLKPHWPRHDNLRDPEKRLKIGYVSADFRNHPVAFFFEPMLARHDKSQVEVFCYYNHAQHDSFTDRIKSYADHWIPCVAMSDDHLAERIRNDGIDILIDLSGHTAHHRLLTFARKPAPVQATWIGYAGTTGLAAIDYRITDEFSDPSGQTEQFHTEQLIRLPLGASYQSPANSPDISQLPALTSERFTFASLNNLAKLNRSVVKLWAQILSAVPHGVLMLGNAGNENTQRNLIDMFAQHGVSPSRLLLQPTMALADYLMLHHQIDLALDPFPYNGGTTTCHSLWMGVPVITLQGENVVSRVGSALMKRAGLPEFVTTSTSEYLSLAVKWAHALPELNELRQSLRERISAGLMPDPVIITRGVEQALRDMWSAWCRQPDTVKSSNG